MKHVIAVIVFGIGFILIPKLFITTIYENQNIANVEGKVLGMGADWQSDYSVQLLYPEKLKQGESRLITAVIEYNYVGEDRPADYVMNEVKVALSGANFNIAPASEFSLKVTPDFAKSIAWSVTPKVNAVGIQEVYVRTDGINWNLYLKRIPSTWSRFSFRRNGVESDYSQVVQGVIPVRIDVVSKYSVPYWLVWGLQGLWGLIVFIAGLPLIQKVLEAVWKRGEPDATGNG